DMPRLDELVEQIVEAGRVREKSVPLADGEGERGEERVQQLRLRFRPVLRLDLGRVAGQEPQQGEQRLPEQRPMVAQPGAGADQVRQDAVREVQG
ncbi:MAG: hypothetical protein Q9191_008065, partial [Dirinaria sp. TL-2023a]